MHFRPTDSPRILILDTDPMTFDLLEEWLTGEGLQVIREGPQANGCELVVVDIAYPRSHGPQVLDRIAREHPGMPILALSSGFFSSVACSGECAARLGATAVLAKPVLREALVTATRKLLQGDR